jgi:hypothetical protein
MTTTGPDRNAGGRKFPVTARTQFPPTQLPFQVVAKANADIAARQLGEFTLQDGLPPAFVDGSELRNAYSLTDIRAGALAMLHYCTGATSGGYWAAQSIAPVDPSDIRDCLCALLEIVTANLTLTDAEQGKLDEECAICEATAPFVGCLTLEVPSEIEMTLSGFLAPGNVTIPRADGIGTVGATIDFTQLNGQKITVSDLQPDVSPYCCYQNLGGSITLPVTWLGGLSDVYEDFATFRIRAFCVETDDLTDEWRMQYDFGFGIPLIGGFGPPTYAAYGANLIRDEGSAGQTWYPTGQPGVETKQTLLQADILSGEFFRENIGGQGDFA